VISLRLLGSLQRAKLCSDKGDVFGAQETCLLSAFKMADIFVQLKVYISLVESRRHSQSDVLSLQQRQLVCQMTLQVPKRFSWGRRYEDHLLGVLGKRISNCFLRQIVQASKPLNQENLRLVGFLYTVSLILKLANRINKLIFNQ
jgi:hypothetical protein